MLTRSPTADPKTLKAALNSSQQYSGPAEAGKSVISNDLKIIGQGLRIISRGTLQVDGEIEGDVAGKEIIIGETGQVTGMVSGERVIVRGKIAGAIRSMTVALQSSARVEGDIHHMSLVIEQGAEFDGRCRRPSDPSELRLDLDVYGQGGHPSEGLPLLVRREGR
jgi:cytoskeletal protein CcmA (bactofilin family)